jgi:hypothetical protein
MGALSTGLTNAYALEETVPLLDRVDDYLALEQRDEAVRQMLCGVVSAVGAGLGKATRAVARWKTGLRTIADGANELGIATVADVDHVDLAHEECANLTESDMARIGREGRGRLGRYLGRCAQGEFGPVKCTEANTAAVRKWVRDEARKRHVRECDIADVVDHAVLAFYTPSATFVATRHATAAQVLEDRRRDAAANEVLVPSRLFGIVPWFRRARVMQPVA